MREFLLSVTLSNIQKDVSADFIASESASPPPWSAVSGNPAKITRTLNNTDKKTRKIYFSITDKYMPKSGATTVNLSTTTGQITEDAKSKAEAPGIMLPGHKYYVHAYSNGVFVKTSEPITTVDYPAAPFPKQYNADATNKPFGDDPTYKDYAWNMQMWFPASSQLSYSLEVRKQEIAYLPFRYLSVIDQGLKLVGGVVSAAICTGTATAGLGAFIQRAGGNPATKPYEDQVRYLLGQLQLLDKASLTSISAFVSSARLPATDPASNRNQVLDAMIRVRRLGGVEKDGSPSPPPASVYYEPQFRCFDINGPDTIKGPPVYVVQFVDD